MMNDKFITIVEKARRELSKEKLDQRYVHVAFLIKGKKIIHFSMNNYNRQYVDGKFTTSLHAEIGCVKILKDKGKIKKGFDVLVLRFNKGNGYLCDSRPCSNCKTFLEKKGFCRVYCSTEDGTIQKFKLSEMDEYYSVAWTKLKQKRN